MKVPSAPISIEPMRLTDLDVVDAIDRRCFPQPWQRSVYEIELKNRAACYLVARSVQEVVGYGGCWVIADEAHITTLAVDPDYQCKKIGERLLLNLMEEALMRRASHATLEVREGNCPAQHLYRKYGFRNAAIRKNYYADTGENALVMWADAIHTAVYRQRLYELRCQFNPVRAQEDESA